MFERKRRAYSELRKHTLLELGKGEKEELKTGAMLRLERKHGKSIQELLQVNGESIREVGERLGIDFTTVSKWRVLFGIQSPSRGRRKSN